MSRVPNMMMPLRVSTALVYPLFTTYYFACYILIKNTGSKPRICLLNILLQTAQNTTHKQKVHRHQKTKLNLTAQVHSPSRLRHSSHHWRDQGTAYHDSAGYSKLSMWILDCPFHRGSKVKDRASLHLLILSTDFWPVSVFITNTFWVLRAC